VHVRDNATTVLQAEGVLMELLDVDAGGALLWLASIAALRGESLDELAADVVERRTI
jgi:AmiR/NasT family two-component response regulator